MCFLSIRTRSDRSRGDEIEQRSPESRLTLLSRILRISSVTGGYSELSTVYLRHLFTPLASLGLTGVACACIHIYGEREKDENSSGKFEPGLVKEIVILIVKSLLLNFILKSSNFFLSFCFYYNLSGLFAISTFDREKEKFETKGIRAILDFLDSRWPPVCPPSDTTT